MTTIFTHRVTKVALKQKTIQGTSGPVHTLDVIVEGETPITVTLFSTQPLDLSNVIESDAH